MWEAIESNQRRSWILVSFMAVILVALGFSIGMTISPLRGGALGAGAAALLWFLLWLLAFFRGDSVILATAGAHKLAREDAPPLFNVVEEMMIASGLGVTPEIYLMDDDNPNAFAVGRDPKKCAVVVTAGLLKLLNRDELQGVIGHEIGHLKNRDTSFMILAGVMLGAIVLLAEIFLRGLRFVGGGRRRSSSGGGPVVAILFLVAILFALLAPIIARILYFACSRRREYLADASSARFTRYPEGLASALDKMSARMSRSQEVSRVLAPMYIINPREALAAIGLLSTHPPTEERIRILRSMAGGAGYSSYEQAYKRVFGASRACIGGRTLTSDTPVALRSPSVQPETRQAAAARSRDVGNLLGRLNDLLLMTCACGVGIKVPPDFKGDSVRCPRCGRVNPLPAVAQEASPSGDEAIQDQQPMQYRRTGEGWESFRCSCGGAIQLSPTFSASFVRCARCDRKIVISS